MRQDVATKKMTKSLINNDFNFTIVLDFNVEL